MIVVEGYGIAEARDPRTGAPLCDVVLKDGAIVCRVDLGLGGVAADRLAARAHALGVGDELDAFDALMELEMVAGFRWVDEEAQR